VFLLDLHSIWCSFWHFCKGAFTPVGGPQRLILGVEGSSQIYRKRWIFGKPQRRIRRNWGISAAACGGPCQIVGFCQFWTGFWGDPGGQKWSLHAPEAAAGKYFPKNIWVVGDPGEVPRTHFFIFYFLKFWGPACRKLGSWPRTGARGRAGCHSG